MNMNDPCVQIIHRVEVADQFLAPGVLVASAVPFEVRRFTTIGDTLLFENIDRLARCHDAVLQAGEWAWQKRGNMAVAYARHSGIVRAQCYQSMAGEMGVLLYGPNGQLKTTQNPHLFDASLPRPADDSQAISMRATAPTCTYPVTDGPSGQRTYWFSQWPSESGLVVECHQRRPTRETSEEACLLAVKVEIWDGQLLLHYWTRENCGGDPHTVAIRTDLARWTSAEAV
jgi:hypothetical protein